MDLKSYKWLMLVVMFLECGLGLIPKCMPMTKRFENGLTYMNCFSAGIFLAMSLVHIMPEASEIWSSWVKTTKIERAFPLPYVLYLVGYLLILFTDKVVASHFRPSTKGNKIDAEEGVEMAAPEADVVEASSQMDENVQVVSVEEKPMAVEKNG